MNSCAFLPILFASACIIIAADAQSSNEVVRLEGRVAQLPGTSTNLVFKTESGATYRLERNAHSEALFVDTNLLSKVLLLPGKVHEKSFEVTGNLRSIKDGKVHDLYYYCDICSISTSVPGLCHCCREPSVLTETPTNERR